ncbi:restriction endonuclease subunit S [Victivallaceae bacterium BBE-744-WT-12]|uniref:Restriction endonuclease subunit S n=1 Tax=Victivallis lenta TaxID=2606640 RepID=A0A844GAN2_9BACT|nr:restriction endonuclease subunit S [Victivallis lenta]MST99438.1 restriction endonuclease subunit S [Victivallis lenta]
MNITKVKLSDICIGKGNYGIPASAVPFSEDLYTYLRITDINDDGTLNLADKKSVNDPKAKNYILKENDIVFARTGNSTGRSYFYDSRDGELVYAGFLIKFSLDHQKVNPLFIKYYAISEAYRGWIASFNTGSTRGNINAQTYANMEIPLPPRSQQDLTVDILSSLDSKIRWNTQINHNLEEQIRVLFEDFFINSQHCANWKQGTIADLGNVVGGSTPSKAKPEYYTSNGIAWITPKDLSGNKSKFISKGESDITPAGLRNSSAVIMPRGTVLFSSRAPIGYIAIAKNEITTNQGFKSVVPHLHIGTAFVYCFLKHNLPKIESMASGSTFKEVSGSVMKAIPAVIPAKEALMNFSTITQPLFDQQELLESENQRLTRLRDALLPKLMSGEIDVSEVEI